MIFDDDFTLMPKLRANTIPANWEDLVTKSEDSATDLDINSSKIWFNQYYVERAVPESGFDATFTKSNTKVTSTKMAQLSSSNEVCDEVNVSKKRLSILGIY